MSMLTKGMLRNHPVMQQFNQLMAGKTTYEDKKEAVFQYGEKLGFSNKDMEDFLMSRNNG